MLTDLLSALIHEISVEWIYFISNVPKSHQISNYIETADCAINLTMTALLRSLNCHKWFFGKF